MKILIIEDNEFDYLMLKRNLERAFNDQTIYVEWMSSPQIDTLAKAMETFDVCFVDHGLPTVLGTDLIKKMTGAGVQTPMILLTGDSHPELDENALAAGASDFLHKDKMSVSSVLRSARHCITRKDQERRLREMAYADPLTGLANRAAFDERCTASLERVQKSGHHLSLILLDLDGFKLINDTFGHPHGDKLLQLFARELEVHFTENDLVVRLGGDEFAILIERNGAATTPNDTRNALRAVLKTEFNFCEADIPVFASIGVSTIDATQSGVTPTDLLHCADKNLYADKRRRKFIETQSGPHARTLDPKFDAIVMNLEQAIASNEFELFYQPKVNYKSGKITGLEALLRWNNPSSGEGPGVFIPIAEEFGLINEIGIWVLEQCCIQRELWHRQGFDVPTISVNVSPLQLDSGAFYQAVAKNVIKYRIPPGSIEFELTEGSFGRDANMHIKQMTKISKLGCNWAIDDFGIGYSSLSRLHQLPISKLKIDKSFLAQLPADAAARDISNTIIMMARNLGLGIVAEGVEDMAQLEGLNLADTDEIQGFYCYKPMSRQNTTSVLSARAGAAA